MSKSYRNHVAMSGIQSITPRNLHHHNHSMIHIPEIRLGGACDAIETHGTTLQTTRDQPQTGEAQP